jgi:peroxiredoxin
VKKLAKKPFALIGVHTNTSEPSKLKAIMDKEQLNWRTFAVGDTIKDTWNNPGTPLYYVIDHQGIIQYKWFGSPGEKAIDAALEKLIKVAEGSK